MYFVEQDHLPDSVDTREAPNPATGLESVAKRHGAGGTRGSRASGVRKEVVKVSDFEFLKLHRT